MKCLKSFVSVVMVFSLSIICLLSSASATGSVPPVETVPVEESATPEYLPPEQFFALAAEEGIEPYAVQSEPNTPITSSTGLKGVLLDLFGPYMPTITQLQYRQGSNQYYTYVNDISLDYPWLCSAAIFAIVLYCVFRLGGSLLCKR